MQMDRGFEIKTKTPMRPRRAPKMYSAIRAKAPLSFPNAASSKFSGRL